MPSGVPTDRPKIGEVSSKESNTLQYILDIPHIN